jgi:hypothetical protein
LLELKNNFLFAQDLLSSKKFNAVIFLDKDCVDKSLTLDRLEEVHTLFDELAEVATLEPSNCFACV